MEESSQSAVFRDLNEAEQSIVQSLRLAEAACALLQACAVEGAGGPDNISELSKAYFSSLERAHELLAKHGGLLLGDGGDEEATALAVLAGEQRRIHDLLHLQ